MKIYKLSKVVALPFMIAVLFFFIQVVRDTDYKHLVWIIVPIAALLLIYLFQPQIDYWWLERNPVELDDKLVKMICEINPQYATLSQEEKEEFARRLTLFAEAKEFIAKGSEDVTVPYDVRMMISQVAVKMMTNSKDYLLNKFERIILYKHPFPSPEFPFLHTVETHSEDGVIIMSLEHAQAGLFFPDNYYNLVGHAFAEVFIKSYPKLDYPNVKEEDWNKVAQICDYGKEEILKTTGLKTVDIMVVLINLFHAKRNRFSAVFPEYTETFNTIFSKV
jgi:hypothetical protein